MCAKSLGPAAPPTSVRGPTTGPRGFRTGLGYAMLARTLPNSPSYAVGSSDHSARISPIRSRTSSRRVRQRTPWSAASSTFQP